ncbi:class I SAM-dependent methyltransferase [Actinomycetospora endophytica]|uniref:S-adenosyl-L-methionine-dependent methyltransferase n=1 Tax=Actinomycetospora endophytica TaxID=2291215 RepID=A0ABS8P680_9PSEU|nr:class I SAM-dependent methyltransferase [Actinomycetospora endophytica]MCD2193769.1 class I SAM-dependent methyltransferase [Actinomycetospora endophytica]
MTSVVPDHTAVRVALWRALHLEVDAAPPVMDDTLALELAAPDDDWRDRPDMEPGTTRGARAGMVARARFVDDLVLQRHAAGTTQYVVLGAGLDTFALRHPNLHAEVFEVDQPDTSAWKRRRIPELGLTPPERLRFVPADFEAEGAWWDALLAAGFDPGRPAVVSSTGVSMYLTREANRATLERLAGLAAHSTVAMTFQPPSEMLDGTARHFRDLSAAGAAAAGTPFLSYFAPDEIVALARSAGFREARVAGADELNRAYFDGRADGLRVTPAEEFLVAST